MRDPDPILRAQRAAAVLERAWDRWRTLHGTGAALPPPVSSYVGYSLEEPMGQPRVVFGVAAEEAELLASLLDRHECSGPAAMRQQVPAQGTVYPPERLRPAGPAAGDGRSADLPRADGANGHGPLGSWTGAANGHGPSGNWASAANGHGMGGRVNGTSGHGAGSQASLAGQPDQPARPVQAVPPLRPARPAPLALATLPVQAEDGQPGWAAISGYATPSVHAEATSADVAAPGLASDDGQPSQVGEPTDDRGIAVLAFRPDAGPGPFPGPEAEPGSFADDGQAAGGRMASRLMAERARGHRHVGEHALPHSARQRRASAAAERDAAPSAGSAALPQGASRGRVGRDYQGLSTMAGDLAGWASGELPGQASRPPGAVDRGRAPGPLE